MCWWGSNDFGDAMDVWDSVTSWIVTPKWHNWHYRDYCLSFNSIIFNKEKFNWIQEGLVSECGEMEMRLISVTVLLLFVTGCPRIQSTPLSKGQWVKGHLFCDCFTCFFFSLCSLDQRCQIVYEIDFIAFVFIFIYLINLILIHYYYFIH